MPSSRCGGGPPRGLTEKLDWNGSVPPLNSLGDGGMLPASLPPLHEVAAPLSWRKELASADATCLVEIGQKKCPLRECLHPDKVNGMSSKECRECYL